MTRVGKMAPPEIATQRKEPSRKSERNREKEERSEYKRLMAVARGEIIPEGSRTQLLDLSGNIMGIKSNYRGRVLQTGQVHSKNMHKLGWNPNASTAADQANATAQAYRKNPLRTPPETPKAGVSPYDDALGSFGLKNLTLRQLLSGMALDGQVYNGCLIQGGAAIYGSRNPLVTTDINGTDLLDPKRHALL